MTTREAPPMTEDEFRTLMEKLNRMSVGLTKREKAFVVGAFREGVATADEGEVRGYLQVVEEVVGDSRPSVETLSQEEAKDLGQMLGAIEGQLTPEERTFVQGTFARGLQELGEVRGYNYYGSVYLTATESPVASATQTDPTDPYDNYVYGPSYDPLYGFNFPSPPPSGPPPTY